VVVVDDEESIRNYLSDVLSLDGYDCKCFQESLAALAYLSQSQPPPSLLLTDIRMPGMDGLELLKRVREVSPELPVVLISGTYELAVALEAVRAGATDYLFKPAKPAEIRSLVAKHVRTGSETTPQVEAGEVQRALASFLAQYTAPGASPAAAEAQAAAAQELFQTLGHKRYETMQHSLRVAAYSVLLGDRCGLTSPQLHRLELGALLHDIGKIAIPRNVLLKPGALSEKEWEVMRTHPVIGYQLLAALPDMEEAAEIVYSHHERFDGKGYPRCLASEQIPLGARLFSIVDTFDAITCDRPYRRAQSFQVAFQEISNGSGTQFDPRLVTRFIRLPEAELASIRDRFPETE